MDEVFVTSQVGLHTDACSLTTLLILQSTNAVATPCDTMITYGSTTTRWVDGVEVGSEATPSSSGTLYHQDRSDEVHATNLACT